MSATLALLLGSVGCDVAGQLCFKRGVGHEDAGHDGALAFSLRLARSPWIAAGVAIYVVEFALWYAALTLAPLSFAFPVAALSYAGVVVASRLVLAERVSARRWLGTAAIAGGVALVCCPELG